MEAFFGQLKSPRSKAATAGAQHEHRSSWAHLSTPQLWGRSSHALCTPGERRAHQIRHSTPGNQKTVFANRCHLASFPRAEMNAALIYNASSPLPQKTSNKGHTLAKEMVLTGNKSLPFVRAVGKNRIFTTNIFIFALSTSFLAYVFLLNIIPNRKKCPLGSWVSYIFPSSTCLSKQP